MGLTRGVPKWGPDIFVTILVLVCSLQNGAQAEKSKSYSMQTLCKTHFLQQLYRKIDGAVLFSQNERNLDCVITFQTHSILQRFMLRFDGLQLDCNDHLFIYDGAHAVGTYKSRLSCKDTKQNLGVLFTRTNYVTLKYVTDNWGTDANGFKLVITAIKDPKHTCTEFRCNHREFCIATDLVCDGINHCADGSDESSNNLCQNNDTGTILGLEVTWFVVAIVSTFLVLLVLIVAVSVCVCRRGSWNHHNRHGNSVTQMYGSNGHMAIKPGDGATKATTLTDGAGGGVFLNSTSGNWRHPVGPFGFLTPPARGRLYCPAG
ncbi:hypothetical protein ABEB36_011670 [Hypothenemus hampei]|uniref:CUB domain-containing protein n=1 Tax=Hypothenemus hampei TaxID=57062 RepID=A0ABD1E8W4_HYPHA